MEKQSNARRNETGAAGSEGRIKGAEREMGEEDERGRERSREEERGETITSLERGQTGAGPGPTVSHRGCLVPLLPPPVDIQTAGFMLELKGFVLHRWSFENNNNTNKHQQ